MDEYELTVLYDTNCLPYDIEKVEQIITNKFIIKQKECEGQKRLAYKINDKDFALYYFYNLIPRDEKQSPVELSRRLNITDNVLRYLLVKVDKRKAK